LDYCVNSIRCMLGFADVHCFSRGLVEPHSYKYPLPLSFFSFSHALLGPQVEKISIVSVFCEVCELFSSNEEEVLEVLL
jgi:hypothetical protein